MIDKNMSEKEKKLAGEIYDSNKNEFIKDIYNAQDKCFEYNQIKPSKLEERKELMKTILGKTKQNFLIEQPFICDYGYNIEIGEKFYSNHNLTILDANKVKFGDNVYIGPNCSFYTVGHPIDYVERNKGLEYAKPIKVGNNVWIGGNVVILPGVTIGDNVVIGAGSVVTKDIPSNRVAVGNPCKVIKQIQKGEKYMATSKDYRDFILEQLSLLENITCRSMMGEYLLYYNSILFGGIYDSRLLIKIVESNKKYNMEEQIPYKGAKPMYLISDIDNKEEIKEIIIETCKDLPIKK